MKIVVATDHGAYEYKKQVIKYLKNKNYEVLDFGTNSKESCDYPDFALKVGESISKGDAHLGILMCGTGIGMSIAANKVKGVRAAVVPNVDYAKLCREHNNANVICLSGRFMSVQDCFDCIDAWLNAKFKGEHPTNDTEIRHKRRVEKIMSIESKYFK